MNAHLQSAPVAAQLRQRRQARSRGVGRLRGRRSGAAAERAQQDDAVPQARRRPPCRQQAVSTRRKEETMTRLFDRIATLLKADAHGVIESLEERSLLLKQYVREAEIELNQQAARLEVVRDEEKRLREALARCDGRDPLARRGHRAGARRRQGRAGALCHPPAPAAPQRGHGAARARSSSAATRRRRSPSASPCSRRSSTACARVCAPSWRATRRDRSRAAVAVRSGGRRRGGRARAACAGASAREGTA